MVYIIYNTLIFIIFQVKTNTDKFYSYNCFILAW